MKRNVAWMFATPANTGDMRSGYVSIFKTTTLSRETNQHVVNMPKINHVGNVEFRLFVGIPAFLFHTRAPPMFAAVAPPSTVKIHRYQTGGLLTKCFAASLAASILFNHDYAERIWCGAGLCLPCLMDLDNCVPSGIRLVCRIRPSICVADYFRNTHERSGRNEKQTKLQC